MIPREAVVLWGAKNIFTVRDDQGGIHDHLRIKGKLLDIDEDAHNPLAPGDRVEIGDGGSGYVVQRRLDRRNAVTRWNRKRRRLQTVAANIDRLYVVGNAGTPRYRPQFVDRVLVMAELGGIDTVIVVNKSDLSLDSDATLHLEILRAAGYSVISTVSRPPIRVEDLRDDATGRVTCLLGQSGVGKSSLINALVPEADLRVGTVSDRYHRGRHTTTMARQVAVSDGSGTVFIDTPGIREFDLFGYDVIQIPRGFREFRRYTERCELPDCSHTHEPGCALRDAVRTDTRLARRYRSYLSIVEDLRVQTGSRR